MALAVMLIIIVGALYSRSVPAVPAAAVPPAAAKTPAVDLPWPAAGQAAMGAQGYGVLASHGDDTPKPIASVAKVITALAVLQKKPLAAGQQGPAITLTQADVDLFNYYYSNDGSVAQVQAGERLTEYQALQALLLPSANNMADTLADWTFGSVDSYVTYANKMVKSMGLDQTTVGDASGFTDTTKSTATDLVKLGLIAIDNPAIASVVSQTSADLPVAGTVQNVNWLLGQDGVIGIKTGNTTEAGGCYLFAAQHMISGRQVTLVGAIVDDGSLNSAIRTSDRIVQASDQGFQNVTVVKKGQGLGRYNAPWGSSAQIVAAQDLKLLVWRGQSVSIQINPQPLKTPVAAGTAVGMITATSGQQSSKASLILSNSLARPSPLWRIFHR